MVGRLIGPVIAALVSLVSGFVVLAVLVYFGSGGADGGGQAAVSDMTRQAVGLATAVISGVVDLVQAIFGAVMRSLD